MANKREYYIRELEKLEKRVIKCDKSALDSMELFIRDARRNPANISDNMEKLIRNEIHKFKNNCVCMTDVEWYLIQT